MHVSMCCLQTKWEFETVSPRSLEVAWERQSKAISLLDSAPPAKPSRRRRLRPDAVGKLVDRLCPPSPVTIGVDDFGSRPRALSTPRAGSPGRPMRAGSIGRWGPIGAFASRQQSFMQEYRRNRPQKLELEDAKGMSVHSPNNWPRSASPKQREASAARLAEMRKLAAVPELCGNLLDRLYTNPTAAKAAAAREMLASRQAARREAEAVRKQEAISTFDRGSISAARWDRVETGRQAARAKPTEWAKRSGRDTPGAAAGRARFVGVARRSQDSGRHAAAEKAVGLATVKAVVSKSPVTPPAPPAAAASKAAAAQGTGWASRADSNDSPAPSPRAQAEDLADIAWYVLHSPMDISAEEAARAAETSRRGQSAALTAELHSSSLFNRKRQEHADADASVGDELGCSISHTDAPCSKHAADARPSELHESNATELVSSAFALEEARADLSPTDPFHAIESMLNRFPDASSGLDVEFDTMSSSRSSGTFVEAAVVAAGGSGPNRTVARRSPALLLSPGLPSPPLPPTPPPPPPRMLPWRRAPPSVRPPCAVLAHLVS